MIFFKNNHKYIIRGGGYIIDNSKSLETALNNMVQNSELSAKCPKCNFGLKVILKNAGSMIKCPNCKTDINIHTM